MSKTIKQISIFLGNTPGSLATMTEKLKECNINARAFNLAENSEFGVLRIIVQNPEDALAALKEHKITARITEVIAVRVIDQPGALNPAAAALGKAGINIRYAYAFTLTGGSAILFIRVDEPEKAVEALEAAGIALETESDI